MLKEFLTTCWTAKWIVYEMQGSGKYPLVWDTLQLDINLPVGKLGRLFQEFLTSNNTTAFIPLVDLLWLCTLWGQDWSLCPHSAAILCPCHSVSYSKGFPLLSIFSGDSSLTSGPLPQTHLIPFHPRSPSPSSFVPLHSCAVVIGCKVEVVRIKFHLPNVNLLRLNSWYVTVWAHADYAFGNLNFFSFFFLFYLIWNAWTLK